jgi:hypothetical protein
MFLPWLYRRLFDLGHMDRMLEFCNRYISAIIHIRPYPKFDGKDLSDATVILVIYMLFHATLNWWKMANK